MANALGWVNGPPHGGGDPRSARDRLIGAASELFCRYGINATGIDAIVEQSGTAKATLYKAFGSKEGLIEAVLQAEGAAWRSWFIAQVESVPGTAAEKLAGSFDVLEQWFSQDRFFGCPFINAVGEFDKVDMRYRNIALEHKMQVMNFISELARETGQEEPDTLAHQLGVIIDGAIVAAMVTKKPEMARYAKKTAMQLLGLAP